MVQKFTVNQFIAHPRFNRRRHENDIALIRLSSIVEYNDIVRPICIIVDDAVHFAKDVHASVFGWGVTSPNSDASDQINTIEVKRQSRSECFESLNRAISISDEQICARALNGGDSCAGDSGGPLGADYTYQGKTSYVQIGIVSSGLGTCDNSGIYTNVESHQTWIVNTVKKYAGHLFDECGRYFPDEIAVRLSEGPQRYIAGTLITDRKYLLFIRDRK
nr:serine protease grass-like [Drosophila takahashii]